MCFSFIENEQLQVKLFLPPVARHMMVVLLSIFKHGMESLWQDIYCNGVGECDFQSQNVNRRLSLEK